MTNEDKLNNENKYTIKILGEEMTITASLSRDYVNELVSYINEIGREIVDTYPHLPRRRLVALTLINIVHQHLQTQEKYKKVSQEKEQLEQENQNLKKEIESLKEEYEELSVLLEEVDG